MKRINYRFARRYLTAYKLSGLFVYTILILFCSSLCIKGQSKAGKNSEELHDSSKVKTVVLVSLGFANEMYSISSHNHIPYLGLGHFIQEKWLEGSLYLGGETGLLLLKDAMLKKVEIDNWKLYPNLSNNFQYQKTNGLSPKSQAYQKYADIIQNLNYNLRLIDFYTAYRTLHGKGASFNKVKLADDGVISLML